MRIGAFVNSYLCVLRLFVQVVLALLSDTEWVCDEPDKFREIRAVRNHLCDLLNIPQPTVTMKK